MRNPFVQFTVVLVLIVIIGIVLSDEIRWIPDNDAYVLPIQFRKASIVFTECRAEDAALSIVGKRIGPDHHLVRLVGSKEFSCLMIGCVGDVQLNFNGQCFPRWLPGDQAMGTEDTIDLGESNEMPSGFSPEALPHFQAAYPGKPITEDDLFYYIYGILHSEDYRTRYANNLMKELPRIPRVATYEQFMAFVEAGQELARLHVHFEDVKPYDDVTIEYTKSGQPSYRVKQMKWGKIKGKTGNAAKDKTTLIYNDWITVKNIPLEAQAYVVNKKSALDRVVERACVSIDKASGIVNDFNDYAAEMGNERYPLDLFLKIITVSLETMRIVKALPKLEIHQFDK